jgi:hypothetical protein
MLIYRGGTGRETSVWRRAKAASTSGEYAYQVVGEVLIRPGEGSSFLPATSCSPAPHPVVFNMKQQRAI